MARKSRRVLLREDDRIDVGQAAPVGSAGDAADDERPSRTALKDASTELQRLGESLLALRAESLAELELPERLEHAIAEAKRLTSRGAKRRQLQFIGKLMRGVDPDTIRAIRDALQAGRRRARIERA